jgi:hypothetical protein
LFSGLPELIIADIPDRLQYLAGVVSFMQDTLRNHYQIAEAVPHKIDEQAFKGLWQELHAGYEALAQHYQDMKVKILDLKVEKRKFDDMGDDGNDETLFKRERLDLW